MYLLSVQNLDDQAKLTILEKVHENCERVKGFLPYDTEIDKRKYSNLKNWISKRLKEIDVDEQFEWMGEIERKINLDMIEEAQEKQLLKAIRTYQHPTYNFVKFYQLAKLYRHFLLIRLRYSDHVIVDDFINQYEKEYVRSLMVNDQLHQATRDIMLQYSENTTESIQWERWLTSVFYDEQLDGYNRYMALVRLTFISFNYGKPDLLLGQFEMLDKEFKKGKNYSKRLLLNYYDNRVALHSKMKEYDKAVYYGYLSIREKNHDYLTYINNLNGVLIKMERYEEALENMKSAGAAFKSTKNYHAKIGYVAYYINCLLKTGLVKNAKSYAENYLLAYEKEILQYRWYRFFSAYLETLLASTNYRLISQVIHKYKLIEREEKFQSRPDFRPIMFLLDKIALYQEGDILKEELLNHIQQSMEKYSDNKSGQNALKNWLQQDSLLGKSFF
ncbi:MAG: hypothetical protein R2825_22465 [Saprospiraceae bacterium]